MKLLLQFPKYFFIFLVVVYAPAAGAAKPAPLTPLTLRTQMGDFPFKVELAQTPEQYEKGLMFRTRLAPGQGMLFVFPEPRSAQMWMKNTFIPLDIIFIDESGAVESVSADAAPQSLDILSSLGPVKAVLEVNAGTAARIGLEPGNPVVHALLGAHAKK